MGAPTLIWRRADILLSRILAGPAGVRAGPASLRGDRPEPYRLDPYVYRRFTVSSPESRGFFYPRTATGQASLLPRPWYYSGDLLTVEYRTEPGRVAALLPAPLRPGRTRTRWR